MNRSGPVYISKKGWGLILLALILLGGGWSYSQGLSGDGSWRSYFYTPAPKPASSRETAGTVKKEMKGWKLDPFLAPGVDQGQPFLAEIRVALQLAAPFSPDESPTARRTLRETVWSVLEVPRENLLRPGGKDRLQEALTARLNERIFQGTLKGVDLEIRPLS